jgi:hypothetical protein
MTSMTETASLRRYADHLGRQLIGPWWRRSEIVDEVLDGLLCAAEDHLVTCSDRVEAARRAVEEWGAPGEVARAYNDATLRLIAKRLSWQTMCVLPLVAVSWGSVLLGSPAAPWTHHPPILVFAVSVAWLGGMLCLLGALIGLRRGRGIQAAVTRRSDAATTGALAALTGVIVVLCAVVVMLLNRGVTHPESLNWWLVPFPAAVTLLAGVYFGTSLRRFVFMRVAVR